MRRDMDMIREILLLLEDQGGYVEPRDFQLSGYDVKHDQADAWNYDYQLRIMLDGGLIFAEFAKHEDKEVRGADDSELLTISKNHYESVSPIGLTWKGHEFLDNI